ncbi:MAG: type II toxin-antitoxin system mRNA interferase toxin, RelE/StbE family [bacterium]|nr:type II toxin-antitoxin system mRNA interferase toxin, RelE/StbE family [bacterium]
MEIYTASQFRRKFKKLPEEVKRCAKEREVIFRDDPFNPKLETHKLHGKYSKFWAFSITNRYRIMFDFLPDGSVAFVDVDTHDMYR